MLRKSVVFMISFTFFTFFTWLFAHIKKKAYLCKKYINIVKG